MAWTKYNNQNRKRNHRKMSKTDADIVATKSMLIDKKLGYDLPISIYEEKSKKLQGK